MRRLLELIVLLRRAMRLMDRVLLLVMLDLSMCSFEEVEPCPIGNQGDDEEITAKLPALIATKVKTIIDNDPPRLTKAIKRARGRLHFVAKSNETIINY